jgi:hypothetical protein
VSYSSFSTDRSGLGCPWPHCDKDGLCRRHVSLIPEALITELDWARIRRFCTYRYRFAELIQGTGAPLHPSSLRFAEGSSQGPSAPSPEAASRPPGDIPPASKVNGPLGTFTPEGGNAASPSPIRTLCMDCGFVIREGDAPEPVSHGICKACLPARMAEAEAS